MADVATKSNGQATAEQVQAWVQESLQRHSLTFSSPEQVAAQWEDFKVRCENAKDCPTPQAFALDLGYCCEDGLRFLAERGPEYSRTVQRVRDECVKLVVSKLLKPGQNAIGAIFWLKNKAGFRDKSKEETAEAREDWLTQLQAAAASSGRADAPPQADRPLQLLDGQEDALDSGLLPGEPESKVASG
jgi:hypothetical protein